MDSFGFSEGSINYKNSLGNNNEYKLGSLSGFLKKWYKMGFPGIAKDAYDYLNETTFKSNEKGRAVLTMDPLNGPFTDLELESIQVAINNSYVKKEIALEDYLLIWLFMIYGVKRGAKIGSIKDC
ncbi:MAG: Phage integrase family protein [uncultured Sulfurovum sp.]|uniref:Phage integrase family protein n=1 Tax=uncultured Sulfurovum sp. TaxID=269237 RepID=A0A6S6SUL6_9BACT|nr:MAG: Phage integrase family protein [uncultured Sulfurovum sp.]